MVGSAMLAMAPSITASTRPSAMVRIAQYRRGTGRPSLTSTGGEDMPGRTLEYLLGELAGIAKVWRGREFRSADSAFAEQFLDATLKLAFLGLAPAEPDVEIVYGRIRHHGLEGQPDAVSLPPDHLREIGAALAGDRHPHLVGDFGRGLEFDAGTAIVKIADDAIHRRAILVDLGDTAQIHPVAHAVTS